MKTFRNFFAVCAAFILCFFVWYMVMHGVQNYKDVLACLAMLVGVACSANLARMANGVIKEDKGK